jgi:hypothetical protein
MSEFMDNMNQHLNAINQQINSFFAFVMGKLKNFKNLAVGEQISYVAVGVGLVLILISIVKFIL